MAGRREGDEWPADMERRRIAALEKYQRDHPDYVFRSEQVPETNRNRSENRSAGEKYDRESGKAFATKVKGKYHNANRWCDATTLELLAEMKAFVRANNLSCLGEGMEKWKKIAIHLSNPCGLELRRLARSSMVRFDNLRRNYRTHLRRLMDPEIQESLIDYFRLCELQKAPGSTTASTRVVSTMNLALAAGRPSPSPPSTPATKKICRRRTYSDESSDSGRDSGRQALHENEDDTMSSAVDNSSGDDTKLSADGSSGSSDDEAVELGAVSGSPHPPLMNVDTPIRLLPPPAAAIKSSDQESSDEVSTEMPPPAAEIKSSDQESTEVPPPAAAIKSSDEESTETSISSDQESSETSISSDQESSESSYRSFSSGAIRNMPSSQRQLRTSTIIQRNSRRTSRNV